MQLARSLPIGCMAHELCHAVGAQSSRVSWDLRHDRCEASKILPAPTRLVCNGSRANRRFFDSETYSTGITAHILTGERFVLFLLVAYQPMRLKPFTSLRNTLLGVTA